MLTTRICELFEIEHPILNAPMAGTAGARLAAAVSEAGGLGLLGGTTPGGPDALRAEIRAVRERTGRPFGVGFISSFPGLDALVQVALEERVPAICHSFADPTPYVGPAHAAGIKVLCQVQTVAQAKVAATAGVDVIAAQGTEAGGHTGYVGTLPLLLAVLDIAGAIPVVAAGGIADGRGLAAVLLAGAEGAWMGTRFVASVEASGADWVKVRVARAGTDDTVLTRVYDLISEAPFPPGIGDRVLRNDFVLDWHGKEDAVEARRPELAARVDSATRSGDAEVAPARAGSAAGLIHSILPAAEIVQSIVAEAEQLLRNRPGRLLR